MSTSTQRPVRPEGTTPADRGRDGDPFVATSAFLLAAVLASYQLVILEFIPPVSAFAAIFVVLGVALTRSRSRWLLIPVLVITVAYAAGSVPFFAANLANPASPVSFLADAAAVIVSLTLVAGVVGNLLGAGPGGRRPIAVGAVGLAIVAVVVSVVAVANIDADAREPGDVTITAERSTYPAQVELSAGGAGVWIDNRDAIHHTFVVEGTDIRVALPGTSAVRVEADLAPGTYRYLCDVPGHEEMEGELIVR